LAGSDQEVDWMELKDILDYAMRNGRLKIYKQVYIVKIKFVPTTIHFYLHIYYYLKTQQGLINTEVLQT